MSNKFAECDDCLHQNTMVCDLCEYGENFDERAPYQGEFKDLIGDTLNNAWYMDHDD